MFRRILATALVAGLLGGLGISVVQEFTTTPIILHAEKYENAPANSTSGGASHHGALKTGLSLTSPAHAHGPEAAAEEAEGWGPEDGFERTAYTALANVLTGVGFALILVACFALSGRNVTGREGLLWGIAGFGIVSLAPSLGLPPEVPGAMAAELTARQGWWFLCVGATAAGLWVMAFRSGVAWMALGIVLIAAPHLIGAPHPAELGGNVPPELAAHFVAASLVTAAIFWVAVGWLSGTLWDRFKSAA